MRSPTDEEKVSCPDATNKEKKWTPGKVWEAGGPGGKKQLVGTLGKHKHRYKTDDCDWSGLPVPVERVGKKEN